MRRIRAIARKEFIHVFRDPRSLGAALALPIVLILLYGFAVNYDLTRLDFVTVDQDQTETSRRLVEVLANTPTFNLVARLPRADDIDLMFQQGRARVGVVLNPGLERQLLAGRTATVQVLVDGSEGTTANIAQTYMGGALGLAGRRVTERLALPQGLPKEFLRPALDVRSRILYNPDLKSRVFLVPGLIGVILMMLASMLTSGVVVRERERGTFELLAASPVSAPELLTGKLIPYLVLGAFDVVMAVGIGWAVFDVAPKGNLVLLFALSMVFVLCSSAIGLFFSCVAKTQQVAMLLAFVAVVLPTMILSGFAFPIRNMPPILRLLSQAIPATHFIAIARGIILKGATLGDLRYPTAMLLLTTALLLRTAVRRFKKTL